MNADRCMAREAWELAFPAEPRDVAGLRRVVRLHFKSWGLPRQIEAAQLCVSELVTQVIRHVGVGAPTSLRLSMNGTSVRMEVSAPRSLSTTAPTTAGSEAGSDMSLAVLGGVADRWGVLVGVHRNVTWCEIATDLTAPHGHSGGPRVTRAEGMISRYGAVASPQPINTSRLATVVAKDAVIEMIVDLLRWTEAHGYDADDVLDSAQVRFDALA
ncbi:ATP-binding protein [Streptomyces sp. NPDC056549]|uniref:ATP-binding protein n=1 Tax=Streptomyces sp. NPDC056549 TaxID=3345864 RepID=UPI003692BBED